MSSSALFFAGGMVETYKKSQALRFSLSNIDELYDFNSLSRLKRTSTVENLDIPSSSSTLLVLADLPQQLPPATRSGGGATGPAPTSQLTDRTSPHQQYTHTAHCVPFSKRHSQAAQRVTAVDRQVNRQGTATYRKWRTSGNKTPAIAVPHQPAISIRAV